MFRKATLSVLFYDLKKTNTQVSNHNFLAQKKTLYKLPGFLTKSWLKTLGG